MIYPRMLLELTDGVDDAAVSVAGPVHRGEVSDRLLGKIVL